MERDLLTNWAWVSCRILQGRSASRVAIFNLMVESEVVIKQKVANLLSASGYRMTLNAVQAAWTHCSGYNKQKSGNTGWAHGSVSHKTPQKPLKAQSTSKKSRKNSGPSALQKAQSTSKKPSRVRPPSKKPTGRGMGRGAI